MFGIGKDLVVYYCDSNGYYNKNNKIIIILFLIKSIYFILVWKMIFLIVLCMCGKNKFRSSRILVLFVWYSRVLDYEVVVW